MQAVIMAGGKGTRLQSVNSEIPKPMFPIAGKPILEYQIESLKKSGVVDIILIIGYLGSTIQNYFGDGNKFDVKITYIIEDKPLGTAGSFYYLKDKVKEDFLLVFGDLMLDIDWKRFTQFHKEHQAWITLFGHPNSHPFDSDVIITDDEDRVCGIDSKDNVRDYYYHNFVNAGVYVISKNFIHLLDKPVKTDLEKQLISTQIPKGYVFAYRSSEYVKDMGTPDRLQTVKTDVENGIVEVRSLRNKQKAIFLDRDGTINQLRGFVSSPKQLELLPGSAEAIKEINASSYIAIVATNQPVIARGECSFEDLEQIHAKMETELGKAGAYLDDIFFCPHHPDKGFNAEVLELKIECTCRKPKIGMLEQAAKKYNIDFNNSWFVGDSTVDVQTGINAGMRTVLLKTGESGEDGKYSAKPDHISKNLSDAVNYILANDSLPCKVQNCIKTGRQNPPQN